MIAVRRVAFPVRTLRAMVAARYFSSGSDKPKRPKLVVMHTHGAALFRPVRCVNCMRDCSISLC